RGLRELRAGFARGRRADVRQLRPVRCRARGHQAGLPSLGQLADRGRQRARAGHRRRLALHREQHGIDRAERRGADRRGDRHQDRRERPRDRHDEPRHHVHGLARRGPRNLRHHPNARTRHRPDVRGRGGDRRHMTRPQYLQDVPPGRADALPGTPLHKKGTTMNNKTKGVIAGIAGLALLGGGTTFALWSDSATVAGGTITNGNLEVAAIGALAWVDASSPRVDEDHTIDPATWRMVRGDVVEGTQGLGVALQGDNLVAELTVDAPEAVLATGVTVTYDVL